MITVLKISGRWNSETSETKINSRADFSQSIQRISEAWQNNHKIGIRLLNNTDTLCLIVWNTYSRGPNTRFDHMLKQSKS